MPIKRAGELSLYGTVGDSSVAHAAAEAKFEHNNNINGENKSSSIQRQTRMTSAAIRHHRNDSFVSEILSVVCLSHACLDPNTETNS